MTPAEHAALCQSIEVMTRDGLRQKSIAFPHAFLVCLHRLDGEVERVGVQTAAAVGRLCREMRPELGEVHILCPDDDAYLQLVEAIRDRAAEPYPSQQLRKITRWRWC